MLFAYDDRARRHVAAAEPLAEHADVGVERAELRMRAREEMACAADAAQHFVRDDQHAVTFAHGTHRLEVALWRQRRTGRRADHWLEDEGAHVLRAGGDDRRVEL